MFRPMVLTHWTVHRPGPYQFLCRVSTTASRVDRGFNKVTPYVSYHELRDLSAIYTPTPCTETHRPGSEYESGRRRCSCCVHEPIQTSKIGGRGARVYQEGGPQ